MWHVFIRLSVPIFLVQTITLALKQYHNYHSLHVKFTLGLCTVKMILNDINCVSIQVTDTRHIANVNSFKILVKHSKLNRRVSIYLQKKLCYTPGI